MTTRDFFLALLSGIAGSLITILGTLGIDYLSRKDHNFQEQLKFFRDHALKDTIMASHGLDDVYKECLNYTTKNSSSNENLVNNINYFKDSLDIIKNDFEYMNINASDYFNSSEVYVDNLKTVFDFTKEKGIEQANICHDNITNLKIINKKIRKKAIESNKQTNSCWLF